MPVKATFAGGVVLNGDRVLVLEDAWGEWVLPESEFLSGQHYSSAATRGVAEATALKARLMRPLPATRGVSRRTNQEVEKAVRWFLMTLESTTLVTPRNGFRQAVWLSLGEAARRLSWEENRVIITTVRSLAEEPLG